MSELANLFDGSPNSAPQMDVRHFYEWIHARCLVSSKVAGSIKRLWASYRSYCRSAKIEAERHGFTQALATEFHIANGMACGLCLSADADAYRKAYAEPPHEAAVIAHSRRAVLRAGQQAASRQEAA